MESPYVITAIARMLRANATGLNALFDDPAKSGDSGCHMGIPNENKPWRGGVSRGLKMYGDTELNLRLRQEPSNKSEQKLPRLSQLHILHSTHSLSLSLPLLLPSLIRHSFQLQNSAFVWRRKCRQMNLHLRILLSLHVSVLPTIFPPIRGDSCLVPRPRDKSNRFPIPPRQLSYVCLNGIMKLTPPMLSQLPYPPGFT